MFQSSPGWLQRWWTWTARWRIQAAPSSLNGASLSWGGTEVWGELLKQVWGVTESWILNPKSRAWAQPPPDNSVWLLWLHAPALVYCQHNFLYSVVSDTNSSEWSECQTWGLEGCQLPGWRWPSWKRSCRRGGSARQEERTCWLRSWPVSWRLISVHIVVKLHCRVEKCGCFYALSSQIAWQKWNRFIGSIYNTDYHWQYWKWNRYSKLSIGEWKSGAIKWELIENRNDKCSGE